MSSSSFYNQILTHLDVFLSQSNSYHTPNKIKRSLSFSPDLRSSFLSQNLSTSARLKKLASSIESQKTKRSPLRDSNSSFTDLQMKVDYLEKSLNEEKLKNVNYISEISHLKKINQKFEMQLKTHQNNSSINQYNHKAIDYLLKENEELKKFKENVFVLSKRYDDINESVLVSLQQIDMLFTEINHSRNTMSYSNKVEFVESSRASFETVINKLVDMMKSKQDEYNYFISEKEREINELIQEKKALKNLNTTNTIETYFCNRRKQCKSSFQSCCKTNDTRGDESNSSPNMDYKLKRIRKNYSCK